MNAINLNLEGDGAFQHFAGRETIHLGEGTVLYLAGLEGGMRSGAPSVMLAFELPDGRVVVAETSLRLLLTAADALRARYGDPR